MPRSDRDYDGLFFLPETDSSGHIRLEGNDATVSVVGDLRQILKGNHGDIQGNLADGRKISLINCIGLGSTQFYGESKIAQESKIYPHIVVLGQKMISSDTRSIKRISYECGKGHCFCAWGDNFEALHPDPEALDTLLDQHHEMQVAKNDEDNWQPSRRQKPLGKRPLVAYFDGNFEIATAEIPSGTISISNSISYGPGTAKGVHLKNSIVHTIEFKETKTLSEALQDLRIIHQFYELLMDQKLKYLKIRATMDGQDNEIEAPLGVRWNRCNAETKEGQNDIHPVDVPILASAEPDAFQTVLANWTITSSTMQDSRLRLLSGLLCNKYGYDRLVGAANMFDLLPDDKVPQQEEISSELSDAVAEARKVLRSIEGSPPRDSILSALGRIGSPTLRAKVQHRAAIANKAIGMRLRALDLVCKHAVLCRNHYVHGSEAGFDYEDNFSSFVFLTMTLEFVFAVSDLVELGWDANKYLSRAGTCDHFFRQYVVSYEDNLDDFMGLLV